MAFRRDHAQSVAENWLKLHVAKEGCAHDLTDKELRLIWKQAEASGTFGALVSWPASAREFFLALLAAVLRQIERKDAFVVIGALEHLGVAQRAARIVVAGAPMLLHA